MQNSELLPAAEVKRFFRTWSATRFNPRRYQPGGVGNWSGHLPFAYDLIASLRPNLIVELGTQYGESYFGFCQAVEEHRLSAQCYAVDTWRGDEHTGAYGDSVYDEVDSYNRTHYGSFSSLLRTRFDDAASQFAEASIDLLHIDGLHTYEAVAHDFSHWLPKVKPGGVILLHDVMVRSADFGVWRLWKELTSRFPSLTFYHSWGLGVLQVPGPSITDDLLLNWLFSTDSNVQQTLRSHYVMLAESLEYRCGTRARVSVKDWVCMKLYPFGDTGYSERCSQSVVLPAKQWKHVSFVLPDGKGHGPIRIDPSDTPAIIEISEIQVRRDGNGDLLWHAAKDVGFGSIQVNAEINVLPGSDHFRCASYGFDPQMLLPDIPSVGAGESLYLDIWLAVDTDLALTLPEQLHTCENRLQDLATDRDRCLDQLADMKQRLDAQAGQLSEGAGRWQEVAANEDKFREKLAAIEQQLREAQGQWRAFATDREVKAVATRVEEILRSRIWRTLVRLGGFILRLQGRKSLIQKPLAPLPVAPITVSAPIAPSIPQKTPDSAEGSPRASASRHVRGVMSIADWGKRIESIIASRSAVKSEEPLIAVLTPVWNTPLDLFAEAAISVLEQSCQEWEWCIVDDGSTRTDFHALFPILKATGRIRIKTLGSNHGISYATNQALHLTSCEYICFLDHDDLLAPTALAECLAKLESGLDAVYTDSDKVDRAGIRSEPFYKPDWSPEYFRGVMYVGHLLCVRRKLALEIGGFDSQYDGVQDFEFMLRYSERTHRVGHVSTILYHWRAIPGSVAASLDAKGDVGRLQKMAVQTHLKRVGLPASAESGSIPHRVRIVPLPVTNRPRVSILIPTKDAPELLDRCLSSIAGKTTYSNFQVLCIDNETTDARALDLMERFGVKRVPFCGRFNFSSANNLGVQEADGQFLVFMNNDIEVITDTWIEEMLYYALQNDVGAVGAMLLYPDATVQHAGVVLGCRGTADHVLRHAPADSDGYAGSLSAAHEVSAVTAACMMIKRETFDLAGGFNEHYFTSYQDVDLCLQLRSMGLRNIFTPRAQFFHLESASRGSYYDFVDRNLLLDRWEEVIGGGKATTSVYSGLLAGTCRQPCQGRPAWSISAWSSRPTSRIGVSRLAHSQ
jgi:GT2 family glycosyltransferase